MLVYRDDVFRQINGNFPQNNAIEYNIYCQGDKNMCQSDGCPSNYEMKSKLKE